jgi:hypothetical protein
MDIDDESKAPDADRLRHKWRICGAKNQEVAKNNQI